MFNERLLSGRARSVLTGAVLVSGALVIAGHDAQAQNAAFQQFFFDVCGSASQELAQRCGETPGGGGDLSGDSEDSLNPSQPLSTTDAALKRAIERTREALGKKAEAEADENGDGEALPFGNYSLLVNGRTTWFDRDLDAANDAERGFDGNVYSLQLGADFRPTRRSVLGIFLHYDRTDVDFDADDPGANFTPAASEGGIDSDAYGFTLFGSYDLGEALTLAGHAGFTFADTEIDRTVVFQETTRTVPQTDVRTLGETESQRYQAGATISYDHAVKAVTLSPYAGLELAHEDVDGYSERDLNDSGLAMRVDPDARTSVQSKLGLRISRAFSADFGVIVPQARAEYVHEFANDAQEASFRFLQDTAGTTLTLEGEDPDRDFFNLGGSLLLVLPNGWMPFLDYQGTVGYSDLERHQLTLGLRVEF